MEHSVGTAGELILELDVPGPDQSDRVGEGRGAALGETANVVSTRGPHRPTHRKRVTMYYSRFKNTNYRNVIKILCIE